MAEYIVGIADDSVQDIDRLHREYAVNGMIVRCRDCIFARRLQSRFICTNTGHCESRTVGLDWFCANGERKDDG